MIFENNYTYAGTTAIIYNFKLDYNELGFYIVNNNNILLNSESTLNEIGIEYKKSIDTNWNTIIIADNNVINNIKSGISVQNTLIETETENYLFNPPIAFYKWNHISPIRIVIKNLDENTSYNIRSYYINDSIKYFFNECETITLQSQNIIYKCTDVTGGSTEENEELKNIINIGCSIYNCMTAFRKESEYASDNLGSKTGGLFSAKIIDLGGTAAADSGMNFGSSHPSISTVCHEMAHNLMKPQIDETYNQDAYNKIVKFMEFATDSPKATWRWNNSHNYPIISSAQYSGVYNYIVAAACYVCRDAANQL